MKDSTKTTLKNVFGSLIRNNYAIECGKTLPWWSALIVFILGVFLPVIPTMVYIGTGYGSSFLDSYSYGFEEHLTYLMNTLHYGDEDGNNKYEFKIENSAADGNVMIAYRDGVRMSNLTSDEFDDLVPIAAYVDQSDTYKNNYDLLVYYTNRSNTSSPSISDMIGYLNCESSDPGPVYLWGSETQERTTADAVDESNAVNGTDYHYYRPSYIIFSRDYVYVNIVTPTKDNIDTYQSFTGNWAHHAEGIDVVSDYLTTTVPQSSLSNLDLTSMSNVTLNDDGTATISAASTPEELDMMMKCTAYLDGTRANWKVCFDDAYISGRNTSLLYSTLIYEAIYIALSLFMGLLIYLLTRGKKNYYRYLRATTCQKINAWAALSPGILGMLIGFFAPNYVVVFYVIFLGLRTMWMAMMQLRQK
ncbi:MAG: hypothetical protein LUC16_00600 [Coprobacillus sp.]|nr:hypothetical protein [Coprobacillus sp.]